MRKAIKIVGITFAAFVALGILGAIFEATGVNEPVPAEKAPAPSNEGDPVPKAPDPTTTVEVEVIPDEGTTYNLNTQATGADGEVLFNESGVKVWKVRADESGTASGSVVIIGEGAADVTVRVGDKTFATETATDSNSVDWYQDY
jgi:hypothetical protein